MVVRARGAGKTIEARNAGCCGPIFAEGVLIFESGT